MNVITQFLKWIVLVLSCVVLLNACAVGPDYKRPKVVVPAKFKETPKGWKVAQPKDRFNHGKWWLIFNDPTLNKLENKLNHCNQNIKVALNQYKQARALVDEARAAFFPTLTGSATVTRQRQVSSVSGSSFATSTATTSSGTTGVTTVSKGATLLTSHSLLFDAMWEPDIWGSVRRSVEASVAFAQSDIALLESAALSAQATLAQTYFELRGVDVIQKLLNDTVANYKKILQLTKNQYASGTVPLANVVQAQSQLEAAQAAAINVGIARGQYEHAIAVLVGEPASMFAIATKLNKAKPPVIPMEFPCELLERRPDIASAERLMAQANAQIGVAIAAYYPTLTLTGTASTAFSGLERWFSIPMLNWAIGPQLAETIIDGGLRNATTAAARANYYATVGTYRQTVLAAFQDVEDNLVSIRLLKDEAVVEDKAVASARLATKLVLNQYKSGVVPYSSVVTVLTTQLAAEQNAANINYLRMTSAVGLIKALGGGWGAYGIDSTTKYR